MKYSLTLFLAPLLYLALSTSACVSPQKVIRVEPDEQENVFWYQGQAIAEKKQDSMVVRAAFSHANREYLIFDVEVFNEGSAPILVTPEVMTITNNAGSKRRAANPESILLSMDIKQSQQEANAKNAAIAGGIILVGAAVAVAVSDDGDNNIDTDGDGWVDDSYDARDVLVDAVLPAISFGLSFNQAPILSSPVSELPTSEEAYFWKEVVLRRTTLRAGEHIRGLVAFPRLDETQSLTLEVPIEQEDFIFQFVQRVYQP